MASTKTVTAKNLEALGAERLPIMLMDIAAGDAAVKRRLRLELAGAGSTGDLAKEVRKRLATIARSRSFIEWQAIRATASDLESQRRAIVAKLAKADPAEALNLLWQFMALATSIYGRSDDGSGTLADVFRTACADIGPIALLAKVDPIGFADRVYDALVANSYGQYDGLISTAAPALGHIGLEHLKQRMNALSMQPVNRPADKDRVKIGWSLSGPIYQDQLAETARKSTVRVALKEIADTQGDVDAYIGQYNSETRKVPSIAAEIGKRLLAAGRAEEALAFINAAECRAREPSDTWDLPDFALEDARIAALEALGRRDEAQGVRWRCFERALSAPHLRDYLKRLPDFDDVEAEEKALNYAQHSKHLMQALAFLVAWPSLHRAADLVIRRAADLDGNHYELLPKAADALAAKHPLAATLALRAVIDYALSRNRASRYKHAARHFLECSSLAKGIADFGAVETHEAYAARLRREHGKKTVFWELVG